MLKGRNVGLRARIDADVAVLHEELYDDVVTRSAADNRAWRPISPGPSSPYSPAPPSKDFAAFSVVELEGGELAGEAVLWSIDLHNRSAHVGISFRPRYRGRGYGADVTEVLAQYAFQTLGLQRLQLETSAENIAMQKVAERSGFVVEGTTRASSWVNGSFVSDIVFGLLADEWRQKERDSSR